MDCGEREVAKDKAQLVSELLLNRSHGGRRLASIGAFIVAILDQCNSSCCRSLTVVPFTDGYREACLWCHRLLPSYGYIFRSLYIATDKNIISSWQRANEF